jgi:hypothetical protein
MHEPELGIHEVVVDRLTLAARREDSRATFSIRNTKGSARLESRQHTHKAALNAITFGNSPRRSLLALGSVQVSIRAPGLLGHTLGMGLQPVRLLRHERLQVLEQDPLPPEQGLKPTRVVNGQMTSEDHPIEAMEGTNDLVAVLVNELFHGALGYRVANLCSWYNFPGAPPCLVAALPR